MPDEAADPYPSSYELVRQPDGRVMMRMSQSPSEDEAPDECPKAPLAQRIGAFVTDWALHLLGGAALGTALSPNFSTSAVSSHDWAHLGISPAAVVGCWLLLSFLDRVALQSVTHTTIGKAAFGLTIRTPEACHPPSFWRLLTAWFMSFYVVTAVTIATILSGNDPPVPKNVERHFLSAVDRRTFRGP